MDTDAIRQEDGIECYKGAVPTFLASHACQSHLD